VLKHVEHLMRTKGHCVMVVAEGCGDTLIQSSGEKDAGAKAASIGLG
jgi:6-phosphofructokinase 1